PGPGRGTTAPPRTARCCRRRAPAPAPRGRRRGRRGASWSRLDRRRDPGREPVSRCAAYAVRARRELRGDGERAADVGRPRRDGRPAGAVLALELYGVPG